MIKCFLGMGSNIGDSFALITHALQKLQDLPRLFDLKVSRPYLTSPVSSIPQNYFINAVCCFNTELDFVDLFNSIEEIEKKLGKIPKQKNAPRLIDLDILFYGTEFINEEFLIIPHPCWRERLFVVAPLCDLVDEITIPTKSGNLEQINLKQLSKHLAREKKERVIPLKRFFKLYETCKT